MVRPLMPAPPRPIFVWGAKIMGATMWCWIFWRLKHDWRDVFVSLSLKHYLEQILDPFFSLGNIQQESVLTLERLGITYLICCCSYIN